MGFEPPSNTLQPPHQKLQVRDVNRLVDKLQDLSEYVQEELLWAQASQQEYAN
jgi:hypothetical protein